MEKLLYPAFMVQDYWVGVAGMISYWIIVPKGTLPMDLYNVLLPRFMSVNHNYGWITSKGRFLSSKEAAQFALDNNLLDKRVEHLSTEDYQGNWRYK